MIPAEPGAKLSVSLSSGLSVEIRLGIREVRIGRGAGSDLLLPDPSVSRAHARIFRVGSQYFLEDRSRNGTFVEGKKISRVPLDRELSFRIGPFLIHFQSGSSLTDREEPPTEADSQGLSPSPDATPALRRRSRHSGGIPGFLGNSAAVRGLAEAVSRAAGTDLPVLIEGETGTGKELVAHAIHSLSPREGRPMVVVNCGAISPELIESELFGHEKGSFTGATAQRRGAFEVAHGGTLFLDEIGELPSPLQPKLLRVLEQKEIKRVGGNETLRVDVRILAATNRTIREEVARKRFREDLYYRISTVTLSVPPLRERREDIPLLAGHFLEGLSARLSRAAPALSSSALGFLSAYPWPGNVRELRNAVHRAAVMGSADLLEATDFSFLISPEPGPAPDPATDPSLSRWEQSEKHQILAELSRQNWNKTRTARELGIAKSTLFEKLRKYGIRPATD